MNIVNSMKAHYTLELAEINIELTETCGKELEAFYGAKVFFRLS